MSATTGATTLDSDQYPCGAANRSAIIAQEDRENFLFTAVAFSCCCALVWLIFCLWHGLTQFAFWRTMNARYLFETRVVCCGGGEADAADKQKQRVGGIIGLLVWRVVAFLWIGITAWYFDGNLYAFTNVTYTFTWIYFLAGTISSIRGFVGITTGERCFSGDPNGVVDWFGTIFALLYAAVPFSILYVDIVFWALLADSTTEVDALNAHVHGPINAIVILVELIVTPTPVSWADMAPASAILQFYAIFFFIYYWAGWGCYPYPFMNTNEDFYGADAGSARIWMLILFAGVVLVHLVLYGLDAAFNAAFRPCYRRDALRAHCCAHPDAGDASVDDSDKEVDRPQNKTRSVELTVKDSRNAADSQA